MPRIPRRSRGEEAAPPEEQSAEPHTSPDGSTAPAPDAPTSGDPLAPPPSAPADASAFPPPTGEPTSTEPPTDAQPAGDAPTVAFAAASEEESAGSSPSADESAAAAPSAEETAGTSPSAEATAAAASTTESPSAIDAPGEQPTVTATPVAMTSGDPLGGVTPAPEAEQVAPQGEAVVVEEDAPADARPGFRQRTRMRRRLRYLRRLRELAFRDLGGLVFDLHRFGRERGDLVAAKLEALANIDRELRTLQDALQQRTEFTDLREAGIAACPRCGTLHDTDANFCPGCGTSLRTAIVRDAAPVTVTPADTTAAPAPADEPETQPTTTPS